MAVPQPDSSANHRDAPVAFGSPTVSVVLPTYNRAGLIGRAIRSVLGQTYRDLELIVVDDGSTDDTAKVVEAFGDPRIRYTSLAHNRGAGAARNAGIQLARGRLLAFQDSDDEWLADKLERHVAAFAGCDAEIGVVYSDMYRIHRNGASVYHRSPAVIPGRLIDPATRFYQVCGLGIQSTVIRRQCFTAVGGFNEDFPALEDLDLFIRLSRLYRFQHLERALVRYFETDGLSSCMPKKIIARSMLLTLYSKDMTSSELDFLTRELARLHKAEKRSAAPPATEC